MRSEYKRRWPLRVLLEICFQPANRPPIFEPILIHFSPALVHRGSAEIDVVQCRNQTGSIPAELAMKIDRMEAWITEDEQDSVNVLLLRRQNGSVHGSRHESNSVLGCFPLF